MNILPKKSWHVRNKNNIEKVRRDEENAAKELLEKERRIALAESEARSEVLRQLARKRRSPEPDEQVSNAEPTESKHINFFQDLESGKKLARKNKEHENEVKKEKEKQEKAIGLLTYLGQGSMELEDKKPWYFDAPVRENDAKDELDMKKKKMEDPLLVMNKYLEATEKYKAEKSGKVLDKKIETAKSAVNKPKAKSKSIEQLRMERLEREKSERIRQQKLLDKMNNVHEEPVYDERKARYNCQFNPDLARIK